jgi:hypothetical protein
MQTWTYETSPVAWDYKRDRSFGAFIVGPVGSGKSVPSLQRIEDLAREQEPSPDGVRRTRTAIIRNTMPELRATTSITYGQIYPPEVYGEIIWRSPATHMMRLPPGPGDNGTECEVNLIALDKPKDVKKLLSLELSSAFVNEIREVPRAVVNRLTERLGRYLLNERANTWSGFWGDTNPPDADHWLYHWHHVERPEGYQFYQQPPGVLEVKEFGGGFEVIDENFPAYCGIRMTSAEVLIWYRGRMQRVDCPLVGIRAADRLWIINPWMENLAALSRVDAGSNPLGVRSYYGRALAGKTLEEIQSYLQGVYTFVSDGRRVVPQYSGQVHAVDNLPVLPDVEILGGMDIGGGTLQPSCILFQKHPRGPYLVHREVVCFDMGVKRFGEMVAESLQKYFPSHVERGLIGRFYGDPAGEKRDEIFETASFDYLRQHFGMNCQAAPTQDIKMRIAAISGPCERLIDGKPGVMVNKSGCPTLHRGLMGAWSFKRLQISGENRYQDTPSKNDESHVCDATGYGFLGAGEFLQLGGRSGGAKQALIADGDFNVF